MAMTSAVRDGPTGRNGTQPPHAKAGAEVTTSSKTEPTRVRVPTMGGLLTSSRSARLAPKGL